MKVHYNYKEMLIIITFPLFNSLVIITLNNKKLKICRPPKSKEHLLYIVRERENHTAIHQSLSVYAPFFILLL